MSIKLVAEFYLLHQFGGGDTPSKSKKWTTFSHNGVLLAPEYQPHGIPVLYNGNKLVLTPLAEEFATAYARYIDTSYITLKSFNKNFLKSWNKILKKEGITTIDSLSNCDFSAIATHLLSLKEIKKNMTKEEKEEQKQKCEIEEDKYKKAMVDGKEQDTGNYRVEPPGIFIGRGCHPKMGTIKSRTRPEDITINASKGCAPEPPTGHKWKKVVHDNTALWLASWKDEINDKTKYVWLGHKSDFKAKSDIEKFDKARKITKYADKIRQINIENLQSSDAKMRQISTAFYFIDKLSLRVGNEKGEDEADTVGVSSLRAEHITLKGNNIIKLDFLGKDSIRYVNEVEIDPVAYGNIFSFMVEKKKKDDLFDLISSADINDYLKTFFDLGLTAKVFRTYNASFVFQQELNKATNKYKNYDKNDKLNMLLSAFNTANAKVALLCNHQKNVSKGFDESLGKLDDKIKTLKSVRRDLEANISKETEAKKKQKYKAKLSSVKDSIKMNKLKKEAKLELKNVSLGTSKMNYIDPRITVAFIKTNNISPDDVFSKALQDKFFWAFEVTKDYQF
jgi:DNA topoisomerase I